MEVGFQRALAGRLHLPRVVKIYHGQKKPPSKREALLITTNRDRKNKCGGKKGSKGEASTAEKKRNEKIMSAKKSQKGEELDYRDSGGHKKGFKVKRPQGPPRFGKVLGGEGEARIENKKRKKQGRKAGEGTFNDENIRRDPASIISNNLEKQSQMEDRRRRGEKGDNKG